MANEAKSHSSLPEPNPGLHDGDIPLYKISEYWETHALANEFNLAQIEVGMRVLPRRRALHRHDFFQIFWITGGRGNFYSDLKPYRIGPGMLLFVTPGQVHSWESAKSVKGYAISFTSDFFLMHYQNQSMLLDLPYFYATQSAPVLQVARDDRTVFDGLLKRIEEEYRQTKTGQGELIRVYTHAFLVEAQRRYKACPPERSQQNATSIVKDFVLLVEQHFKTKSSVRDYAALMNLTPSYLNATCKARTGRTAGTQIRERILLEARRLLAHSKFSISEISYQLHFEDPSYFGRFFKKYQKLSPGEFRELIDKKSQTLQ